MNSRLTGEKKLSLQEIWRNKKMIWSFDFSKGGLFRLVPKESSGFRITFSLMLGAPT